MSLASDMAERGGFPSIHPPAGGHSGQASHPPHYRYSISKSEMHKNNSGGERGIRTPETLAGLRAFQARALGHYAISPRMAYCNGNESESKVLEVLFLFAETPLSLS